MTIRPAPKSRGRAENNHSSKGSSVVAPKSPWLASGATLLCIVSMWGVNIGWERAVKEFTADNRGSHSLAAQHIAPIAAPAHTFAPETVGTTGPLTIAATQHKVIISDIQVADSQAPTEKTATPEDGKSLIPAEIKGMTASLVTITNNGFSAAMDQILGCRGKDQCEAAPKNYVPLSQETVDDVRKANDIYRYPLWPKGMLGKSASHFDIIGAFVIALDKESLGRQFKEDGTPLTSSKGAVGAAQVMPKTAPGAAKLAGLPYSHKKLRTDIAYNKKLGFAYFYDLFERFGKDFPKTYAAYNAGPGATERAIQQAARDRKPDKWLDYLPRETKNYVKKNMAKFSEMRGGGSFIANIGTDQIVFYKGELTRYSL